MQCILKVFPPGMRLLPPSRTQNLTGDVICHLSRPRGPALTKRAKQPPPPWGALASPLAGTQLSPHPQRLCTWQNPLLDYARIQPSRPSAAEEAEVAWG